jgi:hypothetical protein
MAKKTKENYVVRVVMKCKKEITPKKFLVFNDEVHKVMDELQDAYEGKITVYDGPNASVTGYVYVMLEIDPEFAKKNLYFNRKFAPDKYLGFYMSRVARKLRKKYRYFETHFDYGMFKYTIDWY